MHRQRIPPKEFPVCDDIGIKIQTIEIILKPEVEDSP